jgi:hypothetical protein
MGCSIQFVSISRGIPDETALRHEVDANARERNAKATPVKWKFAARQNSTGTPQSHLDEPASTRHWPQVLRSRPSLGKETQLSCQPETKRFLAIFM